MKWLDVMGPPGVGKSSICDPLYGPHCINWQGVNQYDPDWVDFLKVCDRLLSEVKDHHDPSGKPTIEAMLRMLKRSLSKIATVRAMMSPPKEVYIQTALGQRGLGFGWRLYDLGKVDMVADYFREMPVSVGAVILTAPPDIIEQRNKDRLNNPETSHENRDFMVSRMLPAIEIARKVLSERNVPLLTIDTNEETPDESRDKLRIFAFTPASKPAEIRRSNQIQTISTFA